MIRKLATVILLGMAVSYTSVSKAQCGLGLIVSNLNLTWDLNWSPQAISIMVTKANNPGCSYGIGITKGGAADYNRFGVNGAKQIRYQLYSDSGRTRIIKDGSDISSTSDVITGIFPAGAGQSTTVFYYFDVPYTAATNPLVASTNYSDNYVIDVYEGIDPTQFTTPVTTPVASNPVNLSLMVPSIIGLSLVDTGGVFQSASTTKSIDFGSLSPDKISRFDLRVRTNAGFTLTFVSTNGGKMKHASANTYVPYRFSFNGSALDLTAPVTTPNVSGSTTLAGLGYPIQIQILNVGASALTGTYSDSILITATTTE